MNTVRIGAGALALVVFLAMSPTPVGADIIYSGSLVSSADGTGGIQGVSTWIDPGDTTFAWEVTVYDTHVHYKYTLTVPEHDVSHLIIETSTNFGSEDIDNETGNFNGTEIKTHIPGKGNPDMPDDVYGVKFDDTSGTTLVIEFDSTRLPVWGDFYAKDGGNPINQAWNDGFLDDDPTDPPADDSIANHVLVPNGHTPEPAAMALLVLGGTGVLMRRRRH